MQGHRAESPRDPGKSRPWLTGPALAAVVYSLLALFVRALPLTSNVALLVAVTAAYVPLVALLGVLMSSLTGKIRLVIVAVSVLAATLAVQLPWYYLVRPAVLAQHADIRVLSSNLRKGRADAPSFVGLAKRSADVITVSELTPGAVDRFRRAGMDGVFPYSLLAPAPDAGGIGLWSRYPFAPEQSTRLLQLIAVRLRVPGVSVDPLVASVHVISPFAYGAGSFRQWRRDIVRRKAELDLFAEIAGPAAVIVGGDFNSTPDMGQFRGLLTNGYRDAVEQTGAGFTPTFPSKKWLPPLLTIDHVLTRRAAVGAIETIHVPGSDHRALLATIMVTPDS